MTTTEEKNAVRVAGEPYLELPDDLYIPPEALEVFLEAFEGPLDLLLYLIQKQNLDILNIPMLKITQQYMTYIELMTQLKLELAAEYLLMAALLTEIKSRLLLPRAVKTEEGEEEDPRAELIRRLQEYAQMKQASEALDALPRLERDIFPAFVDTDNISVQKPEVQVTLLEIVLALQGVLKRAEQISHHVITKEPLSVRERMTDIMAKLLPLQSLRFETCFNQQEGRAGVVVTFLAILELSKAELIDIIQEAPFMPLSISPRENF